MTRLRSIRALVGPESELVQSDRRDAAATTLQPIRAGVVPVHVMMLLADGLAS